MILDIKEEVRIPQEDQDIILEPGDRIEVLRESIDFEELLTGKFITLVANDYDSRNRVIHSTIMKDIPDAVFKHLQKDSYLLYSYRDGPKKGWEIDLKGAKIKLMPSHSKYSSSIDTQDGFSLVFF